MSSWPEEMRRRTRAFALDVIRFCRTLPHTVEADVFRRQLLKSGTSVGANYRAACQGIHRTHRHPHSHARKHVMRAGVKGKR
jgi:four helix bundle protein